jgi:hypothetical protein
MKKYQKNENLYKAKFLPMPTWSNDLKDGKSDLYNIEQLRTSKFDYLICSSYYYDRILSDKNPIWQQLKNFYLELIEKEKPIQTFYPCPWKNKGPVIMIYKL